MNRKAIFIGMIFFTLLLQFRPCLAQSDASDRYRVFAVSNHDSSLIAYSNEVEVFAKPIVYLPNAFTPNGDGLNDTFGVEVQGLRSMQLRIFDRWGQLVFEADDPNQRWDGSVGGKLGQNGVYAYQLDVKAANGRSIQKEGTITLIN